MKLNRSEVSELELSIVIPVYNECHLIEGILVEWASLLNSRNISHEFVIVNDGSMDGTSRVLDRIRREGRNLRIIHQLNSGHARAIRRGYEAARGKYILQMDANGCYESGDFLELWNERGVGKLVLAQRTHRLDNWIRRLSSEWIKRLIKLLFGIETNDANVPFRLFDRKTYQDIFSALPLQGNATNLLMTVKWQLLPSHTVTMIKIPYRKRTGGGQQSRLSELTHLTWSLTLELFQLRFFSAKTLAKPLAKPLEKNSRHSRVEETTPY